MKETDDTIIPAAILPENKLMQYETGLKFARKCDRKDPLHKFRKQFHFPGNKQDNPVYLCGNSLGLLPRKVKASLNQEWKDWKNLAIKGYLNAKHPWMFYQRNFTKPLSHLLGCKEEEVTVMNALTVNLHLLLFSFYKPEAQRYKILMEAGAFPSDQYAVAAQVKFHGYNPEDAIIEVKPRSGEKLIRHEDILQLIGQHKDAISVVLFGGINYYTGQLFNIKEITSAAHAAGAYAGFDLAHVTGNVPLQLHNWGVDFAAWYSYKYLNGGPGAVAGAYIHETFGNDLNFPRIAGWWGNDEESRFQMNKEFIPKPGAEGWNVSTAQVFNMAALKASLKLVDRAGIAMLRQKSIALTGYLEFLLNQLKTINFEIITSANPMERGAQLSLYFTEKGKEIHGEMTKKGITVDYREPGVIRVAPAPLYNSFEDVYRFCEVLKEFK